MNLDGSFVELYDNLQEDIRCREEGRDKESLVFYSSIVDEIKDAHKKKQRTIRRKFDTITQGNLKALENAGFKIQSDQNGGGDTVYFISW